MRTTVTLDPDVEKLLRSAMRRTGKPFKDALNDALRSGLTQGSQRSGARFEQPVFDLGRPLVDLLKAGSFADELSDQETLDRYRRLDAPARR